ncbi:ABC transporter substrate-binding protein [Actinocorallia sp. API 0066]|uniref:ABC transporter substrate-binding protein n=1 Tax=Actinocorallia sp. API 0066 TaxID=2896846 RepID=UPI001E64A80A|nr:ABC transporter substrate-binding protein [Actinocorallia sp. API 0066]MCD0451479.1 ABC transporter substrate-binding protein [Actinocorallia sp. API 0066]
MRKPLAVALALALAATGCGGDEGAAPEVVNGGTFTFALSADPGALEPASAALGVTNTTLGFAYDTLVHSDADGRIVSGLAERWAATANQVVFTLRKGVTCADGSAVTAKTVADSMNYLSDPKNKAVLLGVLIPAGMTATPDDAAGTVTLTTKEPNPFLVESMTAVSVVCGKGLADRSVLQTGTSGSGPYELTEAVSGDHYTFKVRKDYAWGPGGAGIVDGMPETVVLKIVKDESTAANLLTTGGLTAGQFTGPDRARVKAIPGIREGSAPDGIGEFFFHQGAGKPGASPELRKALVQVLNLDELRKIASGGNGVPATHLTSLAPDPCRGDAVTGNLPAHDAPAAAGALDAAGWAPGPDGIRAKDGKRLKLRIAYQTSAGPSVQAGMEFVAQKWKDLGVETELVGAADAAYADSLFKNGDWDMAWVPLGLSLPTQLVGYLSGPGVDKGGSNFASLNNADYVRLSGEAARSVGAAGCDTWIAAQAALVRNADVVPVVLPTQLVAARDATVEVIGGVVRPTSIRMLAR